MSIEPKMEDLLASIRKAIDSEDGGPESSTAAQAHGTLMRGALRELRVNLNDTRSRNKETREEIAELRGLSIDQVLGLSRSETSGAADAPAGEPAEPAVAEEAEEAAPA